MHHSALSAYGQQAKAAVVERSRLQTVQWLMQYIVEALVTAHGALIHGDYALKGARISDAMNALGILQESLDREKGGEIAENLDQLYSYMVSRLLEASVHKNAAIVTEIKDLMLIIKDGFDRLPAE